MVFSIWHSSTLISDNETQFKSQEFKNFIKTLNIKYIRTAAYHQSSNGHEERYVQTVNNGFSQLWHDLIMLSIS